MNTRKEPIPDTRQGIDKLKDTYLHWTRTQLEKLHTHLHLLERKDVARPDSLVSEIFDLTHNIKGLGGSFGYYLMTDIASSLCEYVRYMEKNTDMKTDVMRAHIIAMDVVISEEIEGSGGDEGNEIIIRLQKLIKDKTDN
ncbi:MAG: Hpt domain-containing protein [Emcibacter sp.]|nr:Hpt domain-containing protein [Emcibacter sp.]